MRTGAIVAFALTAGLSSASQSEAQVDRIDDDARAMIAGADGRVKALFPDKGGPVNLWRPEYGSIWIAQRTGNPDVLRQVPLTRAGRFVAYEALNFIDGRRTLLDIRDAVSAEYGPVPTADVEQYFRFLERLGVLSLELARP